MVDNFAALINCMPVDGVSDSWPRPKAIHFSWLGSELFICCWVFRGSSFASDSQWCCLKDQGSPSVMQQVVSVESSSLRHDLCVYRDDSLTS